MNIALRAIGNTIKPTLEFTVNGDQWTIKMSSTFKNSTDSFKLNETLDEETLDGRKVKVRYFLILFDRFLVNGIFRPHLPWKMGN